MLRSWVRLWRPSKNSSMKILVLAGAGASTGVSAQKYPTTAGFYERYVDKSNLRDRPIFQILDDFVRREKVEALQREGRAPSAEPLIVDIEEILFAARELRQVYAKFHATSRSVARFATWHEKIQSYGSYGNNVTGLLESALPHIDGLVSEINELVHKAYVAKPSDDELDKTWDPFLRTLATYQRTESLNIFTTNYDLVLEAAIRRANIGVDDGSSDDVTRSLSLNRWREPFSLPPSKIGLLTKLHGSLHWLKGDADEIEVTGASFKNHARQVALYPGFKGIPTVEPFNLFHNYFAHCISQADVVIVVGFAFRDEYINSIFRQHLSRSHRLLVVDPRADELPVAGNARVHRCNFRFGDANVEKFLHAALLDKPMPQIVFQQGDAK